jgi:hypothetical protein
MRYRIGLSLLLLGAWTLHADQFNFSYSGTTFGGGTVSASGMLTATEEGTSGVYQVTNISGTRDGKSIVDSGIPGIGELGVFTESGNTFGLGNSGFLAFGVQGVGLDSVAYTHGLYVEMLTSLGFPPSISMTNLSNVSIARITAVPEPSTLLIFLTLGMLVWAVGRKLPTRTARKP